MGKSLWPILWCTSFIIIIFSIPVASIGAIGALDLNGPTPYFANLDINLIEVLSWLMPGIYLLWASFIKKKGQLLPYMPAIKNFWSWNWNQDTKVDDKKAEVEATLPERVSRTINFK
jgi:hypothetical protein